ncbi:MAG: nitroreductase/quinone reductase family protein [Myxococcales bacterium]|nr:nitroreductase/quinone reductase family protein [Myxococcales bacterium]
MLDQHAQTLPAEVFGALCRDRTIDMITLGVRTGRLRTVEIWFWRIEGRIIICGTPDPSSDGGSRPKQRNWLVNLRAHPDFWFCLKESLQFALPATAREITDEASRRHIMQAPETSWYRDHVDDPEHLVQHSPIIEVRFRATLPTLSSSVRMPGHRR